MKDFRVSILYLFLNYNIFIIVQRIIMVILINNECYIITLLLFSKTLHIFYILIILILYINARLGVINIRNANYKKEVIND